MDLVAPICSIGMRYPRATRAAMAVPEATMHEDNLAMPCEDEVWCAWEVSVVQSKSIAESMRNAANQQFWLSVLAPHGLHRAPAD